MAVHSKVDVMARIAVTTTLSAASGGATGFAVRHYFPSALGGTGKFEVVPFAGTFLLLRRKLGVGWSFIRCCIFCS
jgi:hypothetical protein